MKRWMMFLVLAGVFFGCRDNSPCPDGTKRVGDPPPADREQWCVKNGDTKEGPYMSWYSNGDKKEEGAA